MKTDTASYIEASNRAFARSTALSTLVHGAVFLLLIMVIEHSSSLGSDAANEIELELVGSGVEQTDVTQQESNPDTAVQEANFNDTLLAKKDTPQPQKENKVEAVVAAVEESLIPSEVTAETGHVDAVSSVSQMEAAQMLEASASQAKAVDNELVELLHSRNSDKKQYPYFAKRQRREGVATVSFVLYPNGDIEDARLVNSSRTDMLDRAALTAVEKIEPFEAAQDYLETAETFNIDVVFELL